ncbi:hypothetical protein ACFQ29_05060 [Longispora fulva]
MGEEFGQTTGTRVLRSVNGGPPTLEISFQASGTLLDAPAMDMGTYTAELRPNGTILGHGQGVVSTPDGDMLTWTAFGVGQQANGVTQYRGSVVYETGASRFARLNGLCCAFEYEVDDSGKTTGRWWEWK